MSRGKWCSGRATKGIWRSETSLLFLHDRAKDRDHGPGEVAKADDNTRGSTPNTVMDGMCSQP